MILNPTVIEWEDVREREDGTAFGAADLRAYELGVDDSTDPDGVTALLALPVAYGVGQSPIPDFVKDYRAATLFLRCVDSNGIASDWSAGIEVGFISRPRAPAGFSVA